MKKVHGAKEMFVQNMLMELLPIIKAILDINSDLITPLMKLILLQLDLLQANHQ